VGSETSKNLVVFHKNPEAEKCALKKKKDISKKKESDRRDFFSRTHGGRGGVRDALTPIKEVLGGLTWLK